MKKLLIFGVTLSVLVAMLLLSFQEHIVRVANYKLADDFAQVGVVHVYLSDYTGQLTRFSVDFANSSVTAGPERRTPHPLTKCRPGDRATYDSVMSVMSPDKKHIVYCSDPEVLHTEDADGGGANTHTIRPPFRVDAVTWSPNSNNVVVLAEEHKTQIFSLKAVVYAMSGHPLLLTRFHLFIWSPQSGRLEQIPFDSGYIEGAWGSVNWE